MPPTLEVINNQMKNLEKNIEATNQRNLKTLEATEKRNLARHNELKELLLSAIETKADIKDVAELQKDVARLYDNRDKIVGVIVVTVLLAVLGLVLIK